jgi:hypothetical protein
MIFKDKMQLVLFPDKMASHLISVYNSAILWMQGFQISELEEVDQ